MQHKKYEKRGIAVDYMKESLLLHEQWRGKLETVPKMMVDI